VKDLFERRWKILIWAGILFTVTYTVTYVIVLALSFNCIKHIASRNTSGADNAICYHSPDIVLAAGISSTISDAYAILLPWMITRRLGLPVKQKIGLNLVFLTSVLIIVAACFRTVSLVRFHRMQDPSWYAEPLTCTCSNSDKSTGEDLRRTPRQ